MSKSSRVHLLAEVQFVLPLQLKQEEILMEEIVLQIENAFTVLNVERKVKQLEQRDAILAEQQMLRNRWRRQQC